MTFYVKDPATDKAVRKLAKLKGKTSDRDNSRGGGKCFGRTQA